MCPLCIPTIPWFAGMSLPAALAPVFLRAPRLSPDMKEPHCGVHIHQLPQPTLQRKGTNLHA